VNWLTLNPAPQLAKLRHSIGGRTVRCPICGEPYKFYAHSAADQSACPRCVRRAERNR